MVSKEAFGQDMSATFEQLDSIVGLLGRPRSHSRPLESNTVKEDRRSSFGIFIPGMSDLKTSRDMKRSGMKCVLSWQVLHEYSDKPA